ncbi:MAG: GNAT family N-acetyltransferase [Proteobacteria bacterium]|nr:GNAT family N-acetyltransferase [Pseudomonadota bacterium]
MENKDTISKGGRGVFIRKPERGDENEFLEKMERSWRFHHPWIHPPLNREQFAAYLQRIEKPTHRGYLVCSKNTGELTGVVNLNEIVFGGFMSGYLGYYAVDQFAGQGHMSEGLKLVLNHAFKELKLHRLEANVQPENAASIRLVERCGFRKEGFSPRYLKVGGRWRDHERWAVLKEDWNLC